MSYLWYQCLVIGAFLFFSISDITSQENSYSIESAEVSIIGESTLHDWKVVASEISDYPQQLTLNPTGDGVIENFSFKVAVASMDGGRGSSMNNKIFKALKSTSHPYVTFLQSEPTTYTYNPTSKSTELLSKGSVEIAGLSKEIEIEVEGNAEDDNYVLKASHAMKLSDFNIDPPSAMFGQIETKNDIVVQFQFIYKKD